jgi:hypothetical protein
MDVDGQAGGHLVATRVTAVVLIAGSTAAMSLVACRPRGHGVTPPPPTHQSAATTEPPAATTVRPVPPAPPTVPPAATVEPPAATTVRPPARAGKLIIQSTKPVRWSSKCDAETRRALQAGRRRLVITVNAYEPPTSGPAILVVYLLTANGTKRQEIDRFGVHPNAPFRASESVEPQRFLISLADYAKLLEDSEIQLEVGFDPSQGQLRGGMAEISIEFVDL